jgi:glutamyl-tRNA reductase
VHNETTIADSTLTVPYASVELSIGVLGDLSSREVLLVGPGRMSELAARCLRNAGATRLKVMNRTQEKAEEFALKLNATAVSCDDRIAHLKSADIAVCSTSCPHSIISLEDARQVRPREERQASSDDRYGRAARHRSPSGRGGRHPPFRFRRPRAGGKKDIYTRRAPANDANKIVAAEGLGFRRRLMAERVIPTVVALRQRLDELCQQEVDFVRPEYGPFTADCGVASPVSA